jgi:hypothetical protein
MTKIPLSLNQTAYAELLSCVSSRLLRHAETLRENIIDQHPGFVAQIDGLAKELSVSDAKFHPGSVLSAFRQFAEIWRKAGVNPTFFPQDLMFEVPRYLEHVDETLELIDALCDDPYSFGLPANDEASANGNAS